MQRHVLNVLRTLKTNIDRGLLYFKEKSGVCRRSSRNNANAVHLLLAVSGSLPQVTGYLGLEGSVSLLHAPHRDDDAAAHL